MSQQVMLAAVEGQLEQRGLPTSVREDLLASIDSAGYALVEKAGGEAIAVVDELPAVRKRVAGVAGLYLLEVTVAEGEVVRLWEQVSKAGEVQRWPCPC